MVLINNTIDNIKTDKSKCNKKTVVIMLFSYFIAILMYFFSSLTMYDIILDGKIKQITRLVLRDINSPVLGLILQ